MINRIHWNKITLVTLVLMGIYLKGIAPPTWAQDGGCSTCPVSIATRGDANNDCLINISDPIYILGWLFLGDPQIPEHELDAFLQRANVDGNRWENGDERVDISDPILLLSFLFLGGGAAPLSLDVDNCDCILANNMELSELQSLVDNQFYDPNGDRIFTICLEPGVVVGPGAAAEGTLNFSSSLEARNNVHILGKEAQDAKESVTVLFDRIAINLGDSQGTHLSNLTIQPSVGQLSAVSSFFAERLALDGLNISCPGETFGLFFRDSQIDLIRGVTIITNNKQDIFLQNSRVGVMEDLQLTSFDGTDPDSSRSTGLLFKGNSQVTRISNVTITASDNGIQVLDQSSVNQISNVTITDSNFGIFVDKLIQGDPVTSIGLIEEAHINAGVSALFAKGFATIDTIRNVDLTTNNPEGRNGIYLLHNAHVNTIDGVTINAIKGGIGVINQSRVDALRNVTIHAQGGPQVSGIQIIPSNFEGRKASIGEIRNVTIETEYDSSQGIAVRGPANEPIANVPQNVVDSIIDFNITTRGPNAIGIQVGLAGQVASPAPVGVISRGSITSFDRDHCLRIFEETGSQVGNLDLATIQCNGEPLAPAP